MMAGAHPRWWPRWAPCPLGWPQLQQIAATMLLGLVIGGGIGWWSAREPLPWLAFRDVAAATMIARNGIAITVFYEVNQGCKEHGTLRPTWRIELVAPTGQVSVYAPSLDRPDFSVGIHDYTTFLPLREPFAGGDGWHVFASARCPGLRPETVTSAGEPVAIVTPGAILPWNAP